MALAVTVVVLHLHAMVLEHVERFVLDAPARPRQAHEVQQSIRLHIHVGEPAHGLLPAALLLLGAPSRLPDSPLRPADQSAANVLLRGVDRHVLAPVELVLAFFVGRIGDDCNLHVVRAEGGIEQLRAVRFLDRRDELHVMLGNAPQHGSVGVQRIAQNHRPHRRIEFAQARQQARRGLRLAVLLAVAVAVDDRLHVERQGAFFVDAHRRREQGLMAVVHHLVDQATQAIAAIYLGRLEMLGRVERDRNATAVDIERLQHSALLGRMPDRRKRRPHFVRIHLVQSPTHGRVRRRIAFQSEQPAQIAPAAVLLARLLELKHRTVAKVEHRQTRDQTVGQRMSRPLARPRLLDLVKKPPNDRDHRRHVEKCLFQGGCLLFRHPVDLSFPC